MSQATTAMPYRTPDPFRFSGLLPRMRQLLTLLRKELRESLWFTLAFLLILSIDPLQYAFNPSPSTLPSDVFGVIAILLAILAGIVSGLRDLASPRQDFWRSRPITARAFALTRLTAGLFSWLLPVIFVFTAYILLCHYRTLSNPYVTDAHIDRFLSPNLPQISFAFAAFAVAHLAATLLRSAIDAALLTLAVLLCLWLLPIILPPLSFLNTLSILRHSPLWIYPLTGGVGVREGDALVSFTSLGIRLRYRPDFLFHLLGMLTIAAVCSAAACRAVSRNWHTPFNRKFTLWSLGASAVLLLAAAGLQIRSTLSSTQELPILSPTTGRPCVIRQFIQTDRQLFAIAYAPYDARDQDNHAYYAFPLTSSAGSWSLGRPIPLGHAAVRHYSPSHYAWSPALPDRIFTLDHKYTEATTPDGHWTITTHRLLLREISLAPETPGQLLRETDLLPLTNGVGASILDVQGSTLLLRLIRPTNQFILQYDLASQTLLPPDDRPSAHGDTYSMFRAFDDSVDDLGRPREPHTLTLPPLPGLTPAERLDALARYLTSNDHIPSLAANRLALLDHDGTIRAYRQTDLTPTLARFAPVGQYTPSTIESQMYKHQNTFGASGNWLYRLYWPGTLRLFHITDSSITLAGQFNRPADYLYSAHITNQTLLAGGQKLYIIPLPNTPPTP